MSINCCFYRLSPDDFQQMLTATVIRGPIQRRERLEEFKKASLNIRKEWHGLHFLLTGDTEMDGERDFPPLGMVIAGGIETEWDAGYGPMRYLTPADVRTVSIALKGLPEAEVRSRLRPEDFRRANVYPAFEAWDERLLADVFLAFQQVYAFFERAAEAGDGILIEI